jgi:hypothetical protein
MAADRTLRRVVPKIVVAAVTAAWLSGGAASAAEPIHRDQRFSGLVNGRSSDAPVYVFCPGPVTPTRTGPPARNAGLEVVRHGRGFTGRAGNRVVATFREDPSAPVIFTTFRTPQTIPSSLRLPCFGTGLVTFTPESGSPTARPVTVTVRFVDTVP